MPKYLLLFEKTETVRWLGHLDILRAFERAIRRAGLPIAFSQGFNPRERLAFASALSTGITGKAEPALLELTESMVPEQVQTRLNEALPPGIRIRDCVEIAEADARDLLSRFDRAEYEVACACSPDLTMDRAQSALDSLLAQPQICVTREREGRTRTADIRPFLFALSLLPERAEATRLTLRMVVALGEGGIARPSEIVASLAQELPGLTLRRALRVCVFQSNPKIQLPPAASPSKE